MKTLKLEVGKTYRNRKGEEVKIVKTNNSAWPYIGDNEESYNEQGRFYSVNWDSPCDLIEEVTISDANQKQNEMETLKLEVGKTYRSRAGEEVKIVRTSDSESWPFVGDNGKTYSKSGSHWYSKLPDDLIEEVLSKPTRHTFDVPDGVKKIAVSQEGNRIIVEMMSDTEVENKCFPYIPENMKKVITSREMNKVLARIKKVYQLEDLDMDSRRCKQVEAKAILAYYLIEVKKIRHADAAKIVGRKRPMMYHYVKLVEDLYETNIPFRERFNKIGIPWRS